MAVMLGLFLGSGVLLIAAPILWPRRETTKRHQHRLLRLLREQLVLAGLARVAVPTVVVVSLLLAVALAAVAAAMLSVVALVVAAGVIGATLPAMVIVWRAQSARRATRVVWPDVVDHLVSAVRSGLALPDSVVTLAHAGPIPTREAFTEFEENYRATGNFSDSLDRLKERLVDPVADRIIETIRMSREVGGHELPTVLRNLGAYLRQDAAMRAEIEARQSWTVNAARLGVAAPWIVLFLLASRPEAAAAYNSAAGTLVIVCGAALSAVAYRVMKAVGRLPEERRWFA
jgi:tight adherence protein B